jgi:regulator of protease activity HflC (stomatin/prohibitin superfamily)
VIEALSKIIDLIISFWAALRFWEILPAEEIGFVRRLGKPARSLRPGFNWKCPIIEGAETANAQEGVYVLDPQSLRTSDGLEVVVRVSVTFKVIDARKFHLEAWGALNNIRDLVAGEVGEAVRARSADELWQGTAVGAALKSSRKHANDWGIKIVRLRCQDAARGRSIRLWNTNTTADGQG